MRSTNEIQTVVRGYISDNFVVGLNAPDLQDDMNFIEAGIVDSFGLVEVVTFVEGEFDIKLTDDELISPEMTSIAGITRLIERHRS